MKLNRSLAFSCLLLLVSCAQKEVQLPAIDVSGIREVRNHSGIWIFMEIRKGDTLAVLNKNNKLLNTNWIFHIDKRLRMKHIAPLMQDLMDDRNKESMHKKEGMLNYFSYADSSVNAMSLAPFSTTEYSYAEHIDEILGLPEERPCLFAAEVKEGAIQIGEVSVNLNELEKDLPPLLSCPGSHVPELRLVYSENISYQDYLQVRVRLTALGIGTDPVEYLYRVK